MFVLLGCLLAFLIAAAPRLVLIFAAIFGTRWNVVWQGNWILPILGIIFLPYTTVMYMLVWNPVSGVVGFDWVWLGLGLLLDLMKWGSIYQGSKGRSATAETATPAVVMGTDAPVSAPPPETPPSE
jgi:hypothetical protein